MELTALFTLIEKTLYSQGFQLTKLLNNSMTCAHFVLHETDVVRRPIDPKFSYQAFYGHWLEVRECSRRNGAKFNTSYYLAIDECERSSAKDVKKIKLKCDQTEPTLVKKITKFALEYKAYLTNKLLEEQIEELLG